MSGQVAKNCEALHGHKRFITDVLKAARHTGHPYATRVSTRKDRHPVACAWVVELARATGQSLLAYARTFGLITDQPGA